MVKRYILTGTPGCGKTAILRQLETAGFGVVEEAATDVIALEQARGIEEPWTRTEFVETVARMQTKRMERFSSLPDPVQFHDRSLVCTRALAAYLGIPEPEFLAQELERAMREHVFEKQVFFIRPLGFVELTAARRIRFEESLHFERMHEDAYRALGFELQYIERGSVVERAAAILGALASR